MAFRWRSNSDKGDILTESLISELRKKVDYIASQLIPDKDINLPKWTNNTKLTKEDILEELRINIDYIKENNYCRQYSPSECLDKFATYDSSKYSDKQSNVLLADYISAEAAKKDARNSAYFNSDNTSQNTSVEGGYGCGNHGASSSPCNPFCASQCNIEA